MDCLRAVIDVCEPGNNDRTAFLKKAKAANFIHLNPNERTLLEDLRWKRKKARARIYRFAEQMRVSKPWVDA